MPLITKSSEMPLKYWAKVYNDSDLNYMFTDCENKHLITPDVMQQYHNFVDEIGIKPTLILAFYVFLVELQNEKGRVLLNEFDTFLNKETEKVNYQRVSNAWTNYLIELENNADLYEFDEYYFENLPDAFFAVKSFVFYHIFQYRLATMDMSDRDNLNNELFLKKHLKSRKVKLNCKILTKYLTDIFIKKEMYEYSFDVFVELLHPNNLQPVHLEKKQTFELELQYLQKLTGNALPLATSMLSEYIAAKDFSKIINKPTK